MLRGLYTSAVGMINQMKRMDVTANNLANADSFGFKRDVVVSEAFSDVLVRRVRDYELGGFNVGNSLNMGSMSLGIFVNSIHRDFSQGSFIQTGNNLDLTLDSQGFFQVAFINEAGESINMYTRNGSFMTNNEGVLSTRDGFAVLNTAGVPITLPMSGEITINGLGQIIINGEIVDTINIANFENLDSLRPFGNNLYSITEESIEIPFEGLLLQGIIETSNVNPIREMVEMISLSRVYEANQRMITIQDQSLGQAVSEIARR